MSKRSSTPRASASNESPASLPEDVLSVALDYGFDPNAEDFADWLDRQLSTGLEHRMHKRVLSLESTVERLQRWIKRVEQACWAGGMTVEQLEAHRFDEVAWLAARLKGGK